jgi:hypothetical protein
MHHQPLLFVDRHGSFSLCDLITTVQAGHPPHHCQAGTCKQAISTPFENSAHNHAGCCLFGSRTTAMASLSMKPSMFHGMNVFHVLYMMWGCIPRIGDEHHCHSQVVQAVAPN